MCLARQRSSVFCLILMLSVLVPGLAVAQRPGDKIEYRAQTFPTDLWEVGTFVRLAPNGTQAIIRQKPSEFYPEGFQRAYDLADIRPTRQPAAPAPAPRPADLYPAPRPVAPVMPIPAPARPAIPAPLPIDAAACGPRPDPVHNRMECVQQVAQQSANWAPCQAGDEVACHRFVRDVARSLAAGDPRWGLITKPRGQQSCDEHECGGHVGGFGGDVVAYLPDGNSPQQWLGTDIIGGAGAPGARPQWMTYDGFTTNRPDNLWIKLPR